MSTSYQPAPPPTEEPEATAHPGRARWIIPAVIVLVGIFLVLPVAGTLSGKLGSVTENDQAAFLPESAESTKSVLLEERFAGAQDIPAIIVWERASGITAADKSAIADAAN